MAGIAECWFKLLLAHVHLVRATSKSWLLLFQLSSLPTQLGKAVADGSSSRAPACMWEAQTELQPPGFSLTQLQPFGE